ncbi:MAG: hypothetical protein IPN34_14500 [Planctomycetes bacterium]|nr:hypothetical protein [Planctomycetota bacterium]
MRRARSVARGWAGTVLWGLGYAWGGGAIGREVQAQEELPRSPETELVRSTEGAQEPPSAEGAPLGPPWNSEGEFEELFGEEIPKISVRESWGEVRAGFYSAIDLLLYDPSNERSSGLRFTDLRPTTELRVGTFAARLELDLIGVDTRNNLYEAWGGLDIDSWLRLRAGQMRFSMGSEGATHESELPFVGYSFVPHLSTRYDVGLRADGELADGLWLSAWGTLGYGFGLEGQKLSSPQLGIRGTVQPFELFGVGPDDGASFLRGVFFGLGFSELLDGDDPLVAVSPLQSVMLVTPKLDGRGGSWRNFEVGYALGPLQVMYEDSLGAYDDVPIAGGRTNIDQLVDGLDRSAESLGGSARLAPRGLGQPHRSGAHGALLVPPRRALDARDAPFERRLRPHSLRRGLRDLRPIHARGAHLLARALLVAFESRAFRRAMDQDHRGPRAHDARRDEPR